MDKPRFVALRMKWASCRARASRHAHHNICFLAPAPVHFGQIIDNLIETNTHEIGKLHLYHCLHARNAQAQTGANDGRFAKWCVAHAVFAKSGNKAFGNFKSATVFGDILPHEHELRMLLHGHAQTVLNGVDETQFSSCFCRCNGFKSVRCIDVVHFLSEVWNYFGSSVRLVKSLLDVFFVLLLDAFFYLGIEDALLQQIRFEVTNGVFGFPLRLQAFWIVFSTRRFFVPTHAKGHEL